MFAPLHSIPMPTPAATRAATAGAVTKDESDAGYHCEPIYTKGFGKSTNAIDIIALFLARVESMPGGKIKAWPLRARSIGSVRAWHRRPGPDARKPAPEASGPAQSQAAGWRRSPDELPQSCNRQSSEGWTQIGRASCRERV